METKMKKLFVLLTSTLLFACSSGPSLDQLAAQMPKDNRSVMLQVPEAGNPVSNGMLVATIRTAGGTSGKRLVSLLASDKADLEKAAKAKNVEMHYIMQK